MDIRKILAQVDAFFEENKGVEAEQLMQESIVQAVREQDDDSLLQLLNELLGYYRETSQKENVYKLASQAIAQAKRMGLEGSIPYATTLLNVANAYRACGKLQESMEYYRQVQEIYDEQLEPDSMFVAGLKNNMSLLCQEMGDFAEAKEKLKESLHIVEKKGAAYELGVTYANLAGTCMQLAERKEAYGYAMKSLEVFRREKVTDSHYAAALATLGTYFYWERNFEKALQYYREAQETVERSLGRNEYYRRLQEYVAACEKAMAGDGAEAGSAQSMEGTRLDAGKDAERKADTESSDERNGREIGLALAEEYYEAFGRPMLEEKFAAYADKIAVGLVGRGSDCFGYDDEASRDHDWGPGFCMWVTDETYDAIGKELQKAYEELPEEFKGYTRAPRVNGRNRRGVMKISDFYRELTGADTYEQIDWRRVQDASLAAAVNGAVFRDDEGVFTAFRKRLKQGYPREILYLKLAESAARFAQAAQYNYPRMLHRGDVLSANMLAWDGVREAMKLQHYIEGKYPPHDKWLRRGLQESEAGREAADLVARIAGSLNREEPNEKATVESVERLGAYFAMELYGKGFISDTESYLDAHSEELVYKASLAEKSVEELAEKIAKLEFEAFDKVQNEGGRASCQNDWYTFSIMRKSQYLTWNKTMLMQYLYDFDREYHRGHNLIEEKYGRMMESTAPEEYEKIKSHFPALTQEKKDIIEQIVGLQVAWMEEFSGRYPALAGNARNIHTWEDDSYDTSYETYLRGELGTYSDKMLELYGRYVVGYVQDNKNLTYDIMKNSVKMYGYESIEEAEKKVGMNS